MALAVGDLPVANQLYERVVELDRLLAGEPTTVWLPAGRTGALWRPGQRLRLTLGNR